MRYENVCHHFLYNKVFISPADETSLETKLFSQFCPSIMVHELRGLSLRTKFLKKGSDTMYGWMYKLSSQHLSFNLNHQITNIDLILSNRGMHVCYKATKRFEIVDI